MKNTSQNSSISLKKADEEVLVITQSSMHFLKKDGSKKLLIITFNQEKHSSKKEKTFKYLPLRLRRGEVCGT